MSVWNSGLKVVYAQETLPIEVVKSVFLAGPSPRDEVTSSWRPEALELLSKLGYDGHVFVPEPRDGRPWSDYTSQIEWETSALNQADAIVFWVPRSSPKMLGLTTNIEWGLWADTGKCILGTPPEAEHVRYLQWMATKMKIPNYSTLEATIQEAVAQVGEGALRKGGCAQVPLHIWKHPTFEEWLLAQKKVGNRLDSARVLWTFRVGQQMNKVFAWCLHVNVWIESEGRCKSNEFVVSRSDTVSCVMYRGDQVVLVREFRSPVRNDSGFVYELPGGSSHNTNETQKSVIAHEVEEETGLKIDVCRFIQHATRQQLATFSAQASTLFSVELNQEELEQLKSDAGNAHGVLEDTERTYVEIWRLKDIQEKQLVDWVTLGMTMSVVSPA